MNLELERHLNEIAIKKERNVKKDARVKNSSRLEQKQPEESAPQDEPTSSNSDQESSSADGSANSQEYADGMPAELCLMPGGSQDAVCEGATGSAELIGSQLTLRSSSQISQASYDDSMPADLRLMLATAAYSDEDDGEPGYRRRCRS